MYYVRRTVSERKSGMMHNHAVLRARCSVCGQVLNRLYGPLGQQAVTEFLDRAGAAGQQQHPRRRKR